MREWESIMGCTVRLSDVLALACPESHGFGFQKSEAQPKPKPWL
jgi:hypothetical protein